MRETGPVRFLLGSTPEEVAAARPYLGIARTQLGIMKSLNPNKLPVFSRRVVLIDGTIIACQSIFGQDIISIAPVVTPTEAVAPAVANAEVTLAELPEFATVAPAPVPAWVVAGYTIVDGYSKPTLWTSAAPAAVLLSLDGYNDGEAAQIITANGAVVAVVGRIDTGSDVTVWWTPNIDGTWSEPNYAGFAWNPLRLGGFLTNVATTTVWDALLATPIQVDRPSTTHLAATPHILRVAFQRSREGNSGAPNFFGRHIRGMCAIEISDGITTHTQGKIEGGSVIDDKSLDDWISDTLADNTTDLIDSGFTPTDALGTVYLAGIYGPFNLAKAYDPFTYTFADGQVASNLFGDRFVAGAQVPAFSTPSFGGPLVDIPSPAQDTSWVRGSTDGAWFTGSDPYGYYFDGSDVLQFGYWARMKRYSASNGLQYITGFDGTDTVVGANSFTSVVIGTTGNIVVDDTSASTGMDRLTRWGGSWGLIHGYGGPFIDGVSPDAAAACGGDGDLPWVWSTTAGYATLPIPADCNYGEALAVGDGGFGVIGYVDSATDEWVVLWFNGVNTLQLEDSNLWFNDVAAFSGA